MKIILKQAFLFVILFFFSSCPANKAAWYNLFGGGEFNKIEISEKKPPKKYGKYKVLGHFVLKKFRILGTPWTSCPYYYKSAQSGKASYLPTAVEDELKATAYGKWENEVTALIDTICYHATIEARACECHYKGGRPPTTIAIYPEDTPKEIQEKCRCEKGKLYWAKEKICAPAYDCEATGISKQETVKKAPKKAKK